MINLVIKQERIRELRAQCRELEAEKDRLQKALDAIAALDLNTQQIEARRAFDRKLGLPPYILPRPHME